MTAIDMLPDTVAREKASIHAGIEKILAAAPAYSLRTLSSVDAVLDARLEKLALRHRREGPAGVRAGRHLRYRREDLDA